MALLTIAKLGNPILRKIATPVDPDRIETRSLQQFLDDMFETMEATGGIGLAAPQVSTSERIIVMGFDGEGGFPATVLINPTIAFYGPQQIEMWEGCLSVDNLRGKVARPSMVRVQGLDRHGRPLDFEATGLYAVCIQHEIDHLQGKLFLDRMTDFSTLTQLEEYDTFWKQDYATVI